ncbi:hypothetical protein MBRA1_001435 [Malassezia brasiliensis]|uniref:Amino acid transporter transmembrane domain-containing protein n=1 Tax=Malassezia brasiliensis TaxID=1821822 RepID=A0AAF0IN76_9BASI|nr:hypothetical protein MBRA1_001435 [Malassezia brasiliensis]
MPGRNAIPVRGQADRNSDLVWSYSRSQAYFGDNITTSPSFVERRWRGNIPEEQRDTESEATQLTGTESATEDETSADYLESSDDDAEISQGRVRDRGAPLLETQKYWNEMDTAHDLDVPEGSRAAPPAYGERMYASRTPTKAKLPRASGSSRSTSKRPTRSHKDFDEGVSDDQHDELENSSRSRSRSPKRLGTETPKSQRLFLPQGKDRAPSRPPRNTSPYTSRSRSGSRYRTQLRAAAPHLRDPYHVDERAPLLRGRSGKQLYHAPMEASAQQSSADVTSVPDEEHGKSTFWQTWFNTVNVLVGVSILSMPLAFASVGWVGGTVVFLLCGWLTNYSGKVLARILAREPHLHTYADIGSYVFGPMVRTCISFLFCFEMWMVSVALLILMSDSMTALLYGTEQAAHPVANAVLKVVGLALVLPTLFLPLKLLSPVSLVGIVSILFLFWVIITDGLVKRHAPGSLWEPGPTVLAVQWKRIPIAFGLIMAGFSSHPVIPSLYRDMRDPSQFDKMLDWAYLTTAAMYLLVASVGYLMFGSNVSDEVTRDLSSTPGFPHALTVTAVVLVTVNPMTKFALALKPVTVVLEKWAGVLEGVQPNTAPSSHDEEHTSFIQSLSGVQAMAAGDVDRSHGGAVSPATPTTLSARATVAAIRVGMALSVLVTALTVPSLERIMGFLGAFLTFNSCIFGPLLANLVLARAEMHAVVIGRDLSILGGTFVLAVLGTLSSLFPHWFV